MHASTHTCLRTVPVTSYLRDSDEFCINPLKVSLDVREGCCKSSVRFPRTTGAGSAEGLKFPWTTDKDGIEDMHRLRPLSRYCIYVYIDTCAHTQQARHCAHEEECFEGKLSASK